MNTGLLDGPWTRRSGADSPYRWLSTAPGELFPEGAARELAAAFPLDAYTRLDTTARPHGKSYRNYSRVLAGPGRLTDDTLPRLWHDLLAQALTPHYRAAVAGVLGQQPASAVEVRLVRHARGDWLGPHTDRADKLFSHIIYFNRDWRPEWGGCLQILRSAHPSDVAAEVVPRLGASALLARADNSWHQVGAVTSDPAPERRSLLIHGLR